MSTRLSWFFSRPVLVVSTAVLFRLALLIYGRWQDAHSAVKYTDVDYLVFTDAARFISRGRSPYERATYRYTPLLAWLLYPTTWSGLWFEFGKVLFATGDVITGWLIVLILRRRGMGSERSMKFASIWLLNPMVANISTRGSSEGLIAVIVVATLWAALEGRIKLAGALLGLGVHVKIYPFIYAASIFWWLDHQRVGSLRVFKISLDGPPALDRFLAHFNRSRWELAIYSCISVTALNTAMAVCYGLPFVKHTFLYHFTRIDHRHNFSVYNTVLHSSSAQGEQASFGLESLAFLPQLLLSVVLVPYLLAGHDLAATMLAQTFAFVTFNKVCTSQYFLWYMVFLPLYLPDSSLLRRPIRGSVALGFWIAGQAVWLQQGYALEFLGKSTFVPGLWAASIAFFVVNCWILGIIVDDIRNGGRKSTVVATEAKKQA